MAANTPAAPAAPVAKTSLLQNVTAGIVLGFTEVVFSVSVGGLIFSGPLESFVARGIAMALITTVIHAVLTTFLSGSKNVVSTLEDGPGVLLALGAASVASAVSASGNPLPTVIAFVLVATLLTGLFLFFIGYFRLGGLVRYVPFPVIGGFLAGTGWLLMVGAVNTMTSYPVEFEYLPQLLTPEQLLRWLPGVIYGLVLFFAVRRFTHFLTLPVILAGGLVVFYLSLLLTGTSIPDAIQKGLLIGPVGGADWRPLPVTDLTQADWSIVLREAGNIGVILVFVAIEMLLTISGMELEFREDWDLNRELRIAGVGNVISGLAGGAIGFHTLSTTMMNRRVGGQGRLPALMTAAFSFLMLLGGTAILTYAPKPLMGGVLFYVGLDFLDEWLIEEGRKLGWTDYGVLWLIFFIIVTAGFLIGVGIGLVLMVILFVINYSRLNLFHRTSTGAEVSSHVERNAYYRRVLANLGQQVYVLELQGFIFFGTANTILEQVHLRLKTPGEKPLSFLILDFRRVTGLDSSAAISLTKVKYLAESHNFTLLFTHLSDKLRLELERNELAEDERIKIFSDLDHGLEWCEDTLLERDQVTVMHIPSTLPLQLADSGFKKEFGRRLIPYLERIQLQEGDYLIHQGDAVNDLYFIEMGQVSVYLELEGNKRVRLQTMSMGTVVGELSFYLDGERSASVIADNITTAYRLTRQAMEEMKLKDQELGFAFNELMLRMVSERLVTTNRELATLNR